MINHNTILQGDVLQQLATLPDSCIDCIVTSPPYYGLRDYGVPGQIGLEQTPEQYIQRMVAVFAQCSRVLKTTGTCWLNIGDSYAGSGKGAGDTTGTKWKQATNKGSRTGHLPKTPTTLKPKDLMLIPFRLALALQASGWWVRQTIIWHKPNPMPESATDRCTNAHEYIFLLTKSPRYYFDAEAIKTESIDGNDAGRKNENLKRHPTKTINGIRHRGNNYNLANKRSVWTVPTQAVADAHFATFPADLIVDCIKAGSSQQGCCTQCGAPHSRKVEKTGGSIGHGSWTHHDERDLTQGMQRNHTSAKKKMNQSTNSYQVQTTGWAPTCTCHSSTTPAIVLDPFMGSGTTAIVARKLGRHYLGIELNPAYITIAHTRLKTELGMFQ